MTRLLDNRLWIVLVGLALAVMAACSSSNSPSDAGGGGGTEDSPQSMSGG